MYPAYPALALNAAVSMHILLSYFGSTDPRDFVSKIPAKLKLGIVSTLILGALDFGVLRTIGVATAYSAPLKIYAPLHLPGVAHPGDNVCLGKEWYRFPSSYFLPDRVKAKFIKSGFSGLLPGEFSEAKVGFGFYPGAWLIPSGMNDENKEDSGKYVSFDEFHAKACWSLTPKQTDIKHCTFLVDSYFPGARPSEHEPNYALDMDTWERLSCERFLNAAQTSALGRLLWLPDSPIIPERHRRKWGQYCLLRRRNQSDKSVQ
jgi:alpha-1,2-mannosyltransferase